MTSVLATDYEAWLPLFLEWEPLHRRLQDLRKGRDYAKRTNDRDRQGWRIEREIAELTERLKPLQPYWRYKWLDAEVREDCWMTFVDSWRRMQLQHDEPVNPDGTKLTKQHSKAWQALVSHMLPQKGEQ